MSLSDADLAEIKQRADKATEGPWTVERCGYSAALPGVGDVWHDSEEGYVYPLALEDAEFIAHAREDVPLLIADLEAKTAEVEALRADNERISGAWAEAIQRIQRQDNAHEYDTRQIEAERDAARAESAELRQALVRTVAHEAELVALLDPDNDEAVEIVARLIDAEIYHSQALRDGNPSEIKNLAAQLIAALRAAANGEG